MKKISVQSERGAVLPLLVIGLLLVGVLVTTGLVKVPQIFRPKAADRPVSFTGPNVQVDSENRKTTNQLQVWVDINSPFGEGEQTGRGAQSIKDKAEKLKKRVLLPLWDKLGAKEVLAQDIAPTQPTPTSIPATNIARTILGWNEVTPLPRRFDGGAGVTNGEYIFVGGGWQDDPDRGISANPAMHSAKINSDGTLGEWRSDLPQLPQESAGNPEMFLYNGYIYLVGGEEFNVRSTNAVYSAKVEYGGTISQWEKISTLPAKVSRESLASGNSYLYVIGGYDAESKQRLNKVYAAKFTSDGKLGEWKEVSSLPKPIGGAGVTDIYTESGPYLFAAGGYDGQNPINSIYSAKVNSDGSLEAWREVGDLGYGNLRLGTYGLLAPALTSSRGYLILTGGAVVLDRAEYSVNSVSQAKVNDDGTISNWTFVDSLPEGLVAHSLVNTSSFTSNRRNIYVIGGYNSNNGDGQFNVYQARLITPEAFPASTYPKNVKLTGCQNSVSEEGTSKSVASAMVSWDPVVGASEYWAVVKNLTENDQRILKQIQTIPIQAGLSTYQIPVNPGQVYDITIRAIIVDGFSDFRTEHIAVVCGAENREGTAAFRAQASSQDDLIKTPFHLYNGPYNFPYWIKLTRDPQFIFAEFMNFKNESKIASDSITYTGPLTYPNPSCSPVPVPVCPSGSVAVPTPVKPGSCPGPYVCVSNSGGSPAAPFPIPQQTPTSASNP